MDDEAPGNDPVCLPDYEQDHRDPDSNQQRVLERHEERQNERDGHNHNPDLARLEHGLDGVRLDGMDAREPEMPLRPRAHRLIRGAARTAAVAGTASVVSGRVHHHQQQKWADEQYEQQMAAQQAVSPPAPTLPPADEDDMIDKLKELASLHQTGALTDEEFAAAKAALSTSDLLPPHPRAHESLCRIAGAPSSWDDQPVQAAHRRSRYAHAGEGSCLATHHKRVVVPSSIAVSAVDLSTWVRPA